MIDPFTAVGTASAILDLGKELWKLSNSLVKLYRDTKTIDQSIEALANEIKAFSDECELVNVELRPVVTASVGGRPSPYDTDNRLWSFLTIRSKDCLTVVEALHSVVNDIGTEKLDIVGQSRRQLKLNKNHEKISKLRNRIRTHADGMRTILLVLNIKITHISTGQAGQELSQKLDDLQAMVAKIQQSMDDATVPEQDTDGDRTLVEFAREVITKGSTMYGQSSRSGSVYGASAAGLNTRVATWVNDLDTIRRSDTGSERGPLATSQRHSTFSDSQSVRSQAKSSSDYRSAMSFIAESVADDDSDDEYPVTLVSSGLKVGNEAFDAGIWKEADASLQDALRRLKVLPTKQRSTFDMFELRYKLAVCAFHVESPEDAEPGLQSLLREVPESDEQRGLIYEAAHLLALLYVRMNDLPKAIDMCEKALKARRRLYGKESDEVAISNALMARLSEMMNDPTSAKIHLNLIPDEQQEHFLKVIDDSLEQCHNTPALTTDMVLRLAPSPQESIETFYSRDHSALTNTPSQSSRSTATPHTPRSDPSRSSSTMEHANQKLVRSTSRGGKLAPMMSGALSTASTERLLSVTTPDLDDLYDASVVGREDSSHVGDANEVEVYEKAPSVNHEDDEEEDDDEVVELVREKTPAPLSRLTCLEKLGFKPKTELEKAIVYSTTLADLPKAIREHPMRASGIRRQFKMKPTPLHYAALFGEVEFARQIVRHGGIKTMNVDLPSLFLWTLGTPFHWAVLARQAKIVDLFITASPGILQTLDRAPDMSKGVYQWWISSTVSAAEARADPYIANQYIDMIRVLLKHGWRINQGIGPTQWTLLHYAVWLGARYDPKGRIVAFLCRKGASPLAHSPGALSPYDWSEQEPIARDIMELHIALDRSKKIA